MHPGLQLRVLHLLALNCHGFLPTGLQMQKVPKGGKAPEFSRATIAASLQGLLKFQLRMGHSQTLQQGTGVGGSAHTSKIGSGTSAPGCRQDPPAIAPHRLQSQEKPNRGAD